MDRTTKCTIFFRYFIFSLVSCSFSFRLQESVPLAASDILTCLEPRFFMAKLGDDVLGFEAIINKFRPTLEMMRMTSEFK